MALTQIHLLVPPGVTPAMAGCCARAFLTPQRQNLQAKKTGTFRCPFDYC
jgi:hypothetical protein